MSPRHISSKEMPAWAATCFTSPDAVNPPYVDLLLLWAQSQLEHPEYNRVAVIIGGPEDGIQNLAIDLDVRLRRIPGTLILESFVDSQTTSLTEAINRSGQAAFWNVPSASSSSDRLYMRIVINKFTRLVLFNFEQIADGEVRKLAHVRDRLIKEGHRLSILLVATVSDKDSLLKKLSILKCHITPQEAEPLSKSEIEVLAVALGVRFFRTEPNQHLLLPGLYLEEELARSPTPSTLAEANRTTINSQISELSFVDLLFCYSRRSGTLRHLFQSYQISHGPDMTVDKLAKMLVSEDPYFMNKMDALAASSKPSARKSKLTRGTRKRSTRKTKEQ